MLRVPRRGKHHHDRDPRETHCVSPSIPQDPWPSTHFLYPAAPMTSPRLLLPGPAAFMGPAAFRVCPTPSGFCASASRWVPDGAHQLCSPPTRALRKALQRGLCFAALPRCSFYLFLFSSEGGSSPSLPAPGQQQGGTLAVLASDSLLSQGLLPLQS